MKVRDACLLPMAALLSMLAGPVSAADAPAAKECSGFRFSLDEELQLFAGKPQQVAAAPAAAAAPAIAAKKLYEVTLVGQSAMRFDVQPGKATVAEGSYAGLLKVDSGASGKLRVTITEAAWIDVISDGQSLESTRHTGSEGCKLLRKSVEFAVRPRSSLLIQISGSTREDIGLTVTNPS